MSGFQPFRSQRLTSNTDGLNDVAIRDHKEPQGDHELGHHGCLCYSDSRKGNPPSPSGLTVPLEVVPMSPPSIYDPNAPQEQPVPLPSAPIRHLSSQLSLQPPLSRRGHGPGLLLFLSPENSRKVKGPKTLDPEPVQKWAEQGFAVAFATLTSTTVVQDVLTEAQNAFHDLGDIVDTQGKFGVVAYDESRAQEISRAVDQNAESVCFIAHGCPPTGFAKYSFTKPTLLHLPQSVKLDVNLDHLTPHSYPVPSGSFVLPNSADYDPGSAALAHSRSLVFLRNTLGGPNFNIEAIWEEHCYFEFEARSVAKTMGTMVAEPYVNHVPTMTGGVGRENLTRFYRDHFIFSNPADARLQVISRTVGPDRVVDEFVYHITHDRMVDWLLPGVPPTNKKLAIPMVAVVNIRGDRLYNEHIWWDQGTALLQCGLLPTHLPYPTPEGGLKSVIRLPVAGAESARMLVDESQGKSNEMLEHGWGVLPERGDTTSIVG